MTMRTDIGRSLAKRLHTALADRKPTQKEKWDYKIVLVITMPFTSKAVEKVLGALRS